MRVTGTCQPAPEMYYTVIHSHSTGIPDTGVGFRTRGNTMGTTRKPKKEKTVIVPPAGVSESGRQICVITHLHGIPEEQIRIDLDRTRLIITSSKTDTPVKKTIRVPEGSRICRKKFRDGILEITLERPL